jgi:hypothetical protein
MDPAQTKCSQPNTTDLDQNKRSQPASTQSPEPSGIEEIQSFVGEAQRLLQLADVSLQGAEDESSQGAAPQERPQTEDPKTGTEG